MNSYYLFVICLLISSCSGNKKNISDKTEVNVSKHIVRFNSIIDTANIDENLT